MHNSCLIYGTGGHAKVVMELAALRGYEVTAFFDDRPGLSFCNRAVQLYDPLFESTQSVMIAIGHNKTRKEIAGRISHACLFLQHPFTSVSAAARIGEGTVVLAGAIIQANVVIGRHVIINAGSVIDHDVVIEDFVHVAPNAYIGGGAVIETGVTVGPGAVVMRNVRIPAWTEVLPNAIIK